MRVPNTPADPPKVPGSTRPPAYINENSHWWDGSQIYGCTTAVQASLRTGREGKVLVGADGRLGVDPVTGLEITGFTENTWIGQSLLHALFALEHNAICDRLKRDYAQWDDERMFQQARLINAALMAKIHTVEWTTSILPNEVIKTAMRTNWHGALGDLQKIFKNLNDNELLGGIPGSPTDHHTAPYALTEEFVAVYRMHALMPDDYTIRSAADGSVLAQYELPDISGRRGRKVLEQFSPLDLFYSFGVANPGALRLHNFPRTLQNLVQDNGDRFDLATVDILRDRERGVPRYNQFRRLIHKPPVTSFEELTDNPQWAAEIKKVYNNDLEKVDLQVGLMAEPLPEGLRVQRHGVPHIRAHGLAPAEERPLLLEGLPPRGLHQAGHRLGREQHDVERHHQALPRACPGVAGARQRVPAVEGERDVGTWHTRRSSNRFASGTSRSRTGSSGPTSSGRFDNYDGSGNQARINWETKFAKGGVGAIISSFVPVHLRGRIVPNYAMIDHDRHIPFWRAVGESVHRHDCRFILQLSHGGRQRDINGIEYPKGLSSTDRSDPLHGFRVRADDDCADPRDGRPTSPRAPGARARRGSTASSCTAPTAT